MTLLAFDVRGVPAPQGSKTAQRIYSGKKGSPERKLAHVNIVDANPEKLSPWRDAVKAAAVRAMVLPAFPITSAVEVELTFRFLRPQGHYGSGKNSHLVKPSAPPFPVAKGASKHGSDLDKLARAVLDALTDAGVLRDDCLVARFGRLEKVWADVRPGRDDSFPGCYVVVRTLGEVTRACIVCFHAEHQVRCEYTSEGRRCGCARSLNLLTEHQPSLLDGV